MVEINTSEIIIRQRYSLSCFLNGSPYGWIQIIGIVKEIPTVTGFKAIACATLQNLIFNYLSVLCRYLGKCLPVFRDEVGIKSDLFFFGLGRSGFNGCFRGGFGCRCGDSRRLRRRFVRKRSCRCTYRVLWRRLKFPLSTFS